MAKKTKEKKEDSVDIFQALADKTNGVLLSQMKAAKYFIDTGNLAFNYIASGKFVHGGLPGGRISEFYGASASAKSLWATNVLFGCQKLGGYAILLDCENASNPEWIRKASHLDVDKVIRYTPKTLEEAFLKMYNVIKFIRQHDQEVPIMIVYDSISVSPTAREYREIDLPDDYSEADFKKIVQRHEQPGERAKVCGNELRKLNGLLEEMDATVLIINQVRSAIGVQFGSPEVRGGGGKALEYYCSQSFRTSAHAHIKNPKLGDMVTGVNVKIANKKNRFFRPHAYAEKVQLLFDRGINPVSGLLEVLIQAERIEGKGGNYHVLPEYLPEGRDSYTFKSSKERGDVPRDLILTCPKIVDAESTEEVEEYLAPYANFEALESEGSIAEEAYRDSEIDES